MGDKVRLRRSSKPFLRLAVCRAECVVAPRLFPIKDRVPGHGARARGARSPAGPAGPSGGHAGRSDDGIIVHMGDGSKRHIASALNHLSPPCSSSFALTLAKIRPRITTIFPTAGRVIFIYKPVYYHFASC